MEHKISVQIVDKTGHTQLMLSPAETVEAIQQNSSAWVYADNKLVQPSMMDEENLTTVFERKNPAWSRWWLLNETYTPISYKITGVTRPLGG